MADKSTVILVIFGPMDQWFDLKLTAGLDSRSAIKDLNTVL